MKKILLVFCFFLPALNLFAQQFSQYNTGTLYDSFENPSQKAFITDTSKQYAANFLFPNFNVNLFLSGDAQATILTRAFLNRYNDSALMINKGKFNHANVNANVYFVMLKMFQSFNGDQELGFSWQMKAEGKALISDETFAALNGTQSFNDGAAYPHIFNGNYYYQTFHQISFTYKEKLNKQFTVGVKLSALLGIQYQKLNITNSNATFNTAVDTAGIALAGRYYASYIPGKFSSRDYLPTFRNPGAAISVGSSYRTLDGFTIQANIKDLGFIHWSKRSNIYDFDGSVNIQGLGSPVREDSIYNKVSKLVHGAVIPGSFTTPIDGRAELSINQNFWLDDNKNFRYSPTLVASKELFYPGFIGALVNPFQYQKYVLTLTTTYDDLKTFNLGVQFMIKTPNFEFFIGSDKLTQTASLIGDQLNKNTTTSYQNSSYTGGNFFLGFSMKFGPITEHPMNSSVIPTGEKGFLGRLWGRLFKTNN